jgi:hypothetical protein
VTSGTTVGWRVRTQDAGGAWSDWSDPAHFTYKPAPALVLDSPASTTFGDPTLRVQAHITGGEAVTKYRIRVAKSSDRTAIVHDSGVRSASTVDYELPWRDPKTGLRVLPADTNRWLNVRVWGDTIRATAEGQPGYVEQWVQIQAVDTGTVVAPSALTVTPQTLGDPRQVWSWTRASAPDAWLVMDGNEVLERLTSSDVTEASGTYTWRDGGRLAPYRTHQLKVRAVEGTARSAASNTVTMTPKVEGVWLIDNDHTDIGAIKLLGVNVDQLVATEPAEAGALLDGRPYRIVYGPSRISGSFTGRITTLTAFDQLEALRDNLSARPRLIWGTRAVRVQVENLSPMPAVEMRPSRLAHAVSFTVTQVED